MGKVRVQEKDQALSRSRLRCRNLQCPPPPLPFTSTHLPALPPLLQFRPPTAAEYAVAKSTVRSPLSPGVGLCKRRRKPRGFTLFPTRVCGALSGLYCCFCLCCCRDLGFGREASEKGSAVGEGMAENPDLLTITGVGPRNLSKLVEKGIAGVAASNNSTKTCCVAFHLSFEMTLVDAFEFPFSECKWKASYEDLLLKNLYAEVSRVELQNKVLMGNVRGRKDETGPSGITCNTTYEDCEE
ncbi:hypothetical protein RHSIM_Rhsim06G0102500 [Rhododendron simsii]|uniref:Uncharacterized protein n=1 Tax=Rhododendron simsii TaxID=118357 RepID=A0A834H5V2_RHOSS|nr:hypothetical protein RHSIM_Rhsim06G0102500 [Rhododendron simsii]